MILTARGVDASKVTPDAGRADSRWRGDRHGEAPTSHHNRPSPRMDPVEEPGSRSQGREAAASANAMNSALTFTRAKCLPGARHRTAV